MKKKYFIHNVNRNYACSKKAERMLVEAAEKEFRYCLVPEDRLDAVVDRLREIQDQYRKKFPRIQAVEVRVVDVYDDNYLGIRIGTSTIQMLRVRSELE